MRSILKKKHKRGDIASLVLMVLVLFTIAVISIGFTKFFKDAITEMKTKPQFHNESMSIKALDTASEGTTYLDYFFFAIFGGLTLGLIISSVYVDTHPAFFVFFIIGWIVVVTLAGIMSQAFVDLTNQTELNATANDFPLTSAIMTRLPVFIFFVVLVVIVVLYGKAKSGGSPI